LKLASYEAALSDLDRAIHYSQSYLPEAHYNHGIVLYNLHRYEDAIKDFNTVLQKDVKN
jgi:tetratricopeptide (TPR) repeat protein